MERILPKPIMVRSYTVIRNCIPLGYCEQGYGTSKWEREGTRESRLYSRDGMKRTFYESIYSMVQYPPNENVRLIQEPLLACSGHFALIKTGFRYPVLSVAEFACILMCSAKRKA